MHRQSTHLNKPGYGPCGPSFWESRRIFVYRKLQFGRGLIFRLLFLLGGAIGGKMQPTLNYKSPEPKPKTPKWYTAVKEASPGPFLLGGIAGATSPFTFVYMVAQFSTGANVFELGQKGNWADNILALCAAASFGGPITLILLIYAMILGYQVGGWLIATWWLARKHRAVTRPSSWNSKDSEEE